MRKLALYLTTLFLFAGLGARAQESNAEHRLFPTSQNTDTDKPEGKQRFSKDELRSMIDSLKMLTDDLRSQIAYRDSMIRELAMTPEEAVTTPEPEIYTAEKTDSLLNMWYLQADMIKDLPDFTDIENIGLFEADSVRYTSSVSDSVLIERLMAMNSYITLPFNPIVKNYMILYTEKNREKMKRLISLKDYYFPIFEEVLSKYEMPMELEYMSIIESALNPTATSRVGARGIWQFMVRTAKQYGLKVNSFVDERLDVEKAADAAARYMKDAYKVFGDWALAISSYNCGPGNVNKAIRRSGGKRDFWSIYPYLPRETRGYMPAFVGAMYAMTYYKEYNIEPAQSQLPAVADTFLISKNLHLQQVSDLTGAPIDLLREMNPQYIHDIVPGNEATYMLKLPYTYTNAFLDCQDSLYTHHADSLFSPQIMKDIEAGIKPISGGSTDAIRYKVKSGDSLGKIASRNHCTVQQLMKWNHLKSSTIRIGQSLIIYRSGSAPKAASSGSTASSATAPGASGECITYTVKAGDTLSSIASKYPGITVKDLLTLNGGSSKITVGQKLMIPKR